MTLDEIGAEIDALRAELNTWDERFLAPLNEAIVEMDQATVRIERARHRLDVMGEQ